MAADFCYSVDMIQIAPQKMSDKHFKNILDSLDRGEYPVYGWLTCLLGHINWQRTQIEKLKKEIKGK